MARRNNPYGSRRRSISRSEKKQLTKSGIGTIEGYLPPVAPGEDYSHEAYIHGRPAREGFISRFTELLKKQEGNNKRSLVGFLGDFLGLLRDFRKQPETGEKDIAEKFVSRLESDNKKKFHTSLRSLTFNAGGKGSSEDEGLNQGKSSRDLGSAPTIGSLSGEPGVKQAVAESVFQNVNLIKNLNTKYFNDIQRMVFKQLGIDIPEPDVSTAKVTPGVKRGRIPKTIKKKKRNVVSKSEVAGPTPMEEPRVITLAEMVDYVDRLKTDEEGNFLDDVFAVLKKMDPDEPEQKLRTRAQLIARDQTQKVFNSLDTARGKDNGFYWYIWSASGGDTPDNRVRDTHLENNGKIFHIDHPPKETGHPGHGINCRCRKKYIYLKSDISKITEKQLGYKDAGQRKEVAKLLPD